MIYTITFNPAIDYIVNVDNYREGIVNRTNGEKVLAGGKGINVSMVLGNLGVENTALGFVAGFTGNEIERVLNELSVKTDFIHLKNGFSRINIKLKADKETEINGQGPQIDTDALDELYKRLDGLKDGDCLVLAGSIPKGISDTVYCDMMKRLFGKNIKIVVDAEKTLLEKTLEYKPFLIKPNHHELGAIFDKELQNKYEVAECAVLLHKKGAKNVFVSMAGDGGVLVTENGQAMYLDAPKGKVINSTGAGDSAVAGFIAGYIENESYEKAFIRGICAGSASAFSHDLASKAEIDTLEAQIKEIEYITRG